MSSIPINTLDNTTNSPKNAIEKGTLKLDNTLIIDTTLIPQDRHIIDINTRLRVKYIWNIIPPHKDNPRYN